MSLLTQILCLDVQNMGEKAVLLAKQGEQEGRRILVQLEQQGEPLPLLSGYSGLLALRKPDGKQVLNPLTRTEEGFSFVLTAQMLAAEGEAQGEVRVTDGDKLLASATFLLQIYPTPLTDEALESGDEYQALSTILNLAPAMQEHLQNEGYHSTPAEKKAVAAHLIDEAQHTTAEEKQAQQAHQTDEQRHLAAGERAAWNAHSGQNLLQNSDWQAPINQRGQERYQTVNQYTVDRWMLMSGALTQSAGGWELAGTVCQLLEERLPKAGQVLTLSVCIDGVVTTRTAMLGIGTPDWEQMGFCRTTAGLLAVWVTGNGVLDWVKLESGNAATPYQAKPYTEEWLCCQRTCKVFRGTETGTHRWAMAPAAQSGYAAAWVPLNVPLRRMPTVSYTGKLQLFTGNTQGRYDVTGIVQENCELTENALLLPCSTAFSSATIGLFLGSCQNVVTLLLDAELYW